MGMNSYSGELDTYKGKIDTYVDGTGGAASGFSGFCAAWKKAADNEFQNAQSSIVTEVYYAPAMKLAGKLNVTLDVTKAAIFDSVIVDGPGSSGSNVGGIISDTNDSIKKNTTGGSKHNLMIGEYKIDEIKWLKIFLNQRVEANPGSKASAASYNYIISHEEYEWSSGAITALDDSDNKQTIKCVKKSD
ncbi:hypothetical protein GGI25_006108 [Coemansia spiralis]|uniref:Uncharacterized protein n=2 Tax=Coemansia TaxID=4863 RepID=A0A9W8G394_9FUNG|nr:hypothetical protein BX070DRAFT_232501 [Coemansia spiralis]KAJ1986959.1 hypothetical protein EDC05_006062 [Coemansia umbellata]KAJ2618992.1 hypothetical protein GGI26_006181 [Coemansia sp. RSA 1358]KAJ2669530.1 hypothetical protein GGI25_006108 [Coemansia spiralis]